MKAPNFPAHNLVVAAPFPSGQRSKMVKNQRNAAVKLYGGEVDEVGLLWIVMGKLCCGFDFEIALVCDGEDLGWVRLRDAIDFRLGGQENFGFRLGGQ
ncbi:hypothetical protein LWI29_007943 [Acer saccharum]|uniref:Uncharacterized protein n=1 Tax=Acer saccharum TaxID=4024 RepID=A0AA39SIE9_ACESA|nr:hypothetical protein LWI29_007943 [Acer saccharum]